MASPNARSVSVRPSARATPAAGFVEKRRAWIKRVRMIPGSEGPTTTAPESSDDTIELELTGDQGVALARAAEAAQQTERRDETGPALAVPAYENSTFRRTARIDFICNVTFAAAMLVVAVAFLWPASERHPPAPAITRPAPLVVEATPTKPAEPQGEPVRITNSFDPTEVFEFPHGTAKLEAREAVADLLLSRARERRSKALALTRSTVLHADRGAADHQAEISVTRLLARAKEPVSGTN